MTFAPQIDERKTAARDIPRLYSPRRFNHVSRARFTRDRWRQLVCHLGREPSYPEKIIIGRAVAIEWELRKLDARLDAGDELSGHALRARLAGENRLRLDLKALGMAPASERPPTVGEYWATRQAGADAEAGAEAEAS